MFKDEMYIQWERKHVLIKLTEIRSVDSRWQLSEIFINPDHISTIREAKFLQKLNEDGRLPKNLDTSHRFSRLVIKDRYFLVVGAPELIERKLHTNSKQLLRG
jgi:hypothetical protein